MPVKPRIKFAPGKTYVYSGTEGVYSVIAGELLEGDSVAAGGNLSHGGGAPSAGDGKDGDVYLDLTDFKVHTKSGGVWGSGSLFKGAAGTAGSAGTKGDTGTGGTKGDAGLRGKVTLEGAGPPGTSTNLATPTGALTDALTDASLTSGDLDLGDIYLDTTNHRFYKKTALGWAARGSSFIGAAGAKGDTGNPGSAGTKGDTGTTGASGPGLKKHSAALTADTYISSGATASAFTTAANDLLRPTLLLLGDEMEDVGSAVTRADYTWNRTATVTATGSKFTIVTAGRYKIDYAATFNVTVQTASASSVDVTAFIQYSTDGGTTLTTMVSQAVTVTSASTATAQTTIELTKTIFLPAATTIFFRAKRSASAVATTVTANAITKTEIGEDTFVVITKL